MKKALVHDWYYVNGGAEKVIHSINNIWNDFEHYALIDFLSSEDREYIFSGLSKSVHTSFIQKFPTAKKNHRNLLQLFPKAMEQFDLSSYDLIISSSSSIAKGVKTNASQTHISYVHAPMRYAWDMSEQYLRDSGNDKGIRGWYARKVLEKIRKWDVQNTSQVDFLVANSNHIAGKIKKFYNRDSQVIYPPVDVNNFSLEVSKDNYYLTASRLVSYKKIDLIVKAFSKLKDKKLIVIGDGPEMNNLKNIATRNVEILGRVSNIDLEKYMQKARAFIFSAEEDFGIIPVEAQACGTPVIAYGKGGALETISNNNSGLFFYEQSADSILEAVRMFEKVEFDPQIIRNNSLKFSKERFESEFKNFVELKMGKRM